MYYLSLLFCLILAFSLRYNWWRLRKTYNLPRVLMYHSIDKHYNEKHDKWRVCPKDFEKQMRWFSKNGWTSFTISELCGSANSSKNGLPEKSFAITFDDGYKDNFKNAFEILKKYNFKATIYLVPNQNKNHWESENTKNLAPLLSENDIKIMQKSGLIEFGSHNLSHVNLEKLDQISLEFELKESKKQIENITKTPCTAFAYPYGKFNENIKKAVLNAGYKNAVIVKRGLFEKGDDFAIKRLGILGTESFFDFWLKITRIRNKL